MNQNGMNWIWKVTRLAIYLRDGMCCAYCGKCLEDGIMLTLDHIIPRSVEGSTHKPDNLTTVCHFCNSSRGDREIAEFVNAVASYINKGVTGDMILNYINAHSQTDLTPYRKQAREIMKNRPTWASALKEANKQ